MTGRVQDAVAARVPGAAALGLVPSPTATALAGTLLADPAWTAELLRRRPGAPRVAATVWWYSVSSVLLTPSLAGLATGIPLSGRLADTSVSFLRGALPVAAVSTAPGADLAAELRESIGAVVAAVAEAGAVRERSLWAVATDSLANRLLAVGRALGEVERVTALAVPLAEAIGVPLPPPRYEDVAGARFTRRASCCLIDRLPDMPTCTSCPHRPPAERRILLADTAARLR